MKFEVIGSGGCVSLPKPLCRCEICKEAREKGRPYSRHGCSLFLHDINLLVDTPEDISHAINNSQIKEIHRVAFSHWDPDHTLGFRVFEHLRLNWFELSEGKKCQNPISLMAMPHVIEDISEIRSKYGSYLDYYENVQGLVKRQEVKGVLEIDAIKISFVQIEKSTIFVFEKNNKKLIYAPCDVKPFPDNELFYGADILLVGNTIVADSLKGGYVLKDDSFLKEDLFSMSEVLSIREKYNIKELIITHLEEDWGKSYDDYLELEKEYENLKFAYDGMLIEL